ncbi:MAG: phosphodiester glycosidase family protein [Clostridia bacterium]|nr:phosphodiester glycosidase family protein [Clostridia bacterium]
MCKKTIALILLLITLFPALPGQAEDAADIRGYSSQGGYQYVQFGSYFTDADGTKQPILWRVLRSANGEAYMLSEYILFGCPLHGDYDHYEGWEKSDLYAYLNGTFKNDAFTAGQQDALLIRTEDNALVTLITSDEMKDASIGFSSNKDRLCESTAWAKILQNPPLWELPKTNNKGKWKKLYVYSNGHKYSPWWSRTRSTDYQHEQRRVMDDGKVGRISVGNSDLGARPAITVDLSKLTIQSGDGTLSSPFLLTAQEPDPTKKPKATATPKPEKEKPTATKKAKATATPKATAKPTATKKASSKKATATPKPSKKKSKNTTVAFTAGADPQFIREEFPALTDAGFLPEGEAEFVFMDDENGLWLYASQSIRIQIERKTGTLKSTKTRWYEAHIFCRDNQELMDFIPYNKAKYTNRYTMAKPEKIALENNLVFGINSDYFIYRVGQSFNIKSYAIGVVIRDGEIYYDKPKKSSSLPPLDVMAFYPDGSVTVHQNSKTTAKELVAAGATDALSFGPILVEKGKISARASQFGEVLNPRTGFGVVEPGHYVAVVADGRLKRSDGVEGVSCQWMAETLLAAGCETAINLDGGATCTMLFMGQRLNKIGNYGSGAAGNREQNELFGIGRSDAVK